jgi:hypothetical protein
VPDVDGRTGQRRAREVVDGEREDERHAARHPGGAALVVDLPQVGVVVGARGGTGAGIGGVWCSLHDGESNIDACE